MRKVKIQELPKHQDLGIVSNKPRLGLSINPNPYANAFRPKPTALDLGKAADTTTKQRLESNQNAIGQLQFDLGTTSDMSPELRAILSRQLAREQADAAGLKTDWENTQTFKDQKAEQDAIARQNWERRAYGRIEPTFGPIDAVIGLAAAAPAMATTLGSELFGTGVTIGNLANTGFATHGVYNFANPESDFRQALSKYNRGEGDWRDVAFEGGLNALNFLGAKSLPGDIKALSNARAPQLYKYNPWAWKPNPEAYYHRSPNLKNIINLENGTLQGFGQSTEGRLFSETKDYFPGTRLNLRKPANSRLYFSKGVPLDYGRYNPETFNEAGKRIMTGQGYAGPYMVEVEGVPMGASVKGRAPSANPPTGLEGYAVSHRPITLPEAKFYKEHWLMGYKPINKAQGGDISIPNLRRVKVGGLPKAQDGTQIVGGIEYLGDVTQNENNYWEERYKYWRSKNLSYKDAYDAATADVNTQRGPSHPYYVYNSNAFLPNGNSGANITVKKPNPYKHLQDWPDFNESGSANDFYGNTDDAARWEKQWYSERAKLPQFKDVAEKRLSLANSIDMQPWSKDNWKNSYSPNAAGYYSWDDATVNIPQSRFSNPLLYTHERSHWYDYNAPQDKTITRYYRKNPLPLYNEYDPILNDIIPIEYTIPGGEGATNDFYSKDSIYTPFKNDDSDHGTDYYYNPTEVRARLNEWRRNHNIDPTKDYSTDEIQQIIDKDINSGNSWNFDLYKVIRGRGDLLKQIHDAYVSTGNKENPNEIPKAKRGLLKAQEGKTMPSISDALETMFGFNKEEEPEESALSYFYNMMTPKPQSSFDYNTYMNHANKYLSRDIFKGSGLTAKDLADAAQDFYNTTNYVYPVDLLLAQGQMESKLGKTLKSQHNYFNVGNTDEGATRNFKSGKDSALNYMNLMYNDYLNKGQKTPEQLLAPNGFVNYAGKRYASNPNYEKEVGDQRAYIKKYLGIQKEGGSIKKVKINSLPNNWKTK